MADKPKTPKKPRKLQGVMSELQNVTPMGFAKKQYGASREAGASRGSALKSSVSQYKQTAEAMRTLRTGRKGGAGDFFTSAGFENLGTIAGALFDKKATKEDTSAARKTLGLKDDDDKKEPTRAAGFSRADKRKLDYNIKLSENTARKVQDIQQILSKVDQSVSYIADRVSPKVIEAGGKKDGKKGREGTQFIQYDPLAPAGEQFRKFGDNGKLSTLKPSKDLLKSATMKAALASSNASNAPALKGQISRFADPKEKSFTEEFKKDPILLLRDEMRSNFDKLFEILEEQKELLEEECSGGSMLDSAAGLLGGAGALGGLKKVKKMRKPKTKPSKSPRKPTRTPTRPIPSDPRGPKKPPTATPPTAKSAKWTKFLKYVEKVAPKLYKKVGTRLATAGGLAMIPGAGWIGAAITILGSAWLAYDLYDLWTEYSDMDESEQKDAMDTVSTSTAPAPVPNEVVPGRIPDQYLNVSTPTPSMPSAPLVLRSSGNNAAKDETTPTGAPAAASTSITQPSFGTHLATPEYGVGATASPGVPPDMRPVPPKKIANTEGKKAVISAMDKRGITDPMARAAIMAQVAHESGGFTQLSENLNYSSGKLTEVFSYYKANPDQARADAKNQVAIGSKAYGNRLGNGPPETGEGYEYRGRGFIQLTGKSNYKRFGVNNPNELLNPAKAAENAVDYMMGYKGNWNDIQSVTRYVNGPSMMGLNERSGYFTSFVNDPEVTGMGVTDSATSAPVAAAPSSGGGGGAVASSGGGGGAVASSGGSGAAAAAGEQALAAAGIVQPSPGGAAIPGASAASAAPSAGGGLGDQSITKEQTDALLGITGQTKLGGLGDQSITKEQTSGLMDMIAQNRAKSKGISVEQAKSELAVTPQATVEPVQTVSGQGMDMGSKLMEFGKSALSTAAAVAPMVINNNQQSTAGKVQQGISVLSALGEAATRPSESAFSRALAKDFSHPTAFTTVGTI